MRINHITSELIKRIFTTLLGHNSLDWPRPNVFFRPRRVEDSLIPSPLIQRHHSRQRQHPAQWFEEWIYHVIAIEIIDLNIIHPFSKSWNFSSVCSLWLNWNCCYSCIQCLNISGSGYWNMWILWYWCSINRIYQPWFPTICMHSYCWTHLSVISISCHYSHSFVPPSS